MDPTIAETAHGRLQGKRTSSGDVIMFRAIPYGAPPVGDGRFRAPQPPEPWSGIRDATRFGSAAPQTPGVMERLWGGGEGLLMDEDCLTLNVWTAGPGGSPRPVMVWIHGGGFMTGSGAIPWYDGRGFVRSADVVFVTINYRLGTLGYLHLAELGGEAYAASGNCGVLDQVAALRWVRDNIAAFGGDPGNVTVFGESAGAMSVGTLLGVPSARGLFHRAILQSGACANVSTSARATAIAVEVLHELGLGTAEVDKLKDLPAAGLLAAQEAVAARHARDRLPFQPVVDGVTLPQAPLAAVGKGAAAGVPLICGTTLEEMKLFTMVDGGGDPALAGRRARALLGGKADTMLDAYRRALPEARDDELWTAVATDAVFRIPAIRLLEAQSALGTPCWSYLFTVRSTAFGGALGSCHALDIPFVFDILDRPGVDLFVGTPPGGPAVAHAMHASWGSFARSGSPASPGLAEWAAYDTDRRVTMEFGERIGPVDDPLAGQREAWAS